MRVLSLVLSLAYSPKQARKKLKGDVIFKLLTVTLLSVFRRYCIAKLAAIKAVLV